MTLATSCINEKFLSYPEVQDEFCGHPGGVPFRVLPPSFT